ALHVRSGPSQATRKVCANVDLRRIALTQDDVIYGDLPPFPAESKRKDPRHKWFRDCYGDQCWELDALPANELRDRVRGEILSLLDIEEWARCKRIEKAERDSIRKAWQGVFSDQYKNTYDGIGGAP